MARLFLLICAMTPAASPIAQDYTFTEIDFPGAADTRALGVNDLNEVVGSYRLFGTRGLFYSGGAFQTIEPERAVFTRIHGINNAGRMVGFYMDLRFGVFRGFIRIGECFNDIDYPPPPQDTRAYGINAFDQVVGGYIDRAGSEHGFLLNEGVYSAIDCPGRTNTRAYGIDDNGTVIGACDNGSVGTSVGFIYKGGNFTTFNCPGASDTGAFAISSNGVIVGSYGENLVGIHGFLTTDWTTCTQFDFPGAPNTELHGITTSGNVVGIYYSDGTDIRGFFATPN